MAGAGSAGKEHLGVGMAGGCEERLGGALFDDFSGVEDEEAIAGVGNRAEVVRNEKKAHAEFLLEGAEKGEDLGLDGGVEGGGGFVGDEEMGRAGEGNRDEDALSLAAAELMGILAEAERRVGKAADVEEFERAGVGFWRASEFVIEESFGDLSANAHGGIERSHGVLENHADVAAEGVTGMKLDASCDGGRGEADEGLDGAGFAGAAFANEAERFSFVKRKGDAADGGKGFIFEREGDVEVFNIEQFPCHRRSLGSRASRSALPRRLKESMVRVIISEGKKRRQG